ncbi:MAG TPA: hypothetical protein VK427_09940 [Kofleriaceae bacterium]|nr:hypothetical protein [Kofleriaceae bacterium]
MNLTSAAAGVATLACFSGVASGDQFWVEEAEAWRSAHRGAVEACALSSNVTGHFTVWFTVDAQTRGKTTVTEILPEQRALGPTPCWRKLLETFHPQSFTKAYAWTTCTVFRPRKNAPSTEKATASCGEWFEPIDRVPAGLVAWLVETQLAPALPSLAKCVEQHGKHLPDLELVLEHAYSSAMSVRYVREAPSSYPGEERSSQPTGTCYAKRILAEQARLVWPTSLPKTEAPALDVFFSSAMFGAKAPRVYVRPTSR